ncbi:MAG TPA: hypothetical protein VE820_07645, partial [Sphingomicrobium sp.]|nr:hypothetical protein [Sphingomicrobium sp.]
HRQYALNQSVTMMAALAAAGLEAEHSRMDWNAFSHIPGHQPSMMPLATPTIAASTVVASSSVAPTHVVQPVVESHAVQASNGSGHPHEVAQYGHFAVGGVASHAPGMTELLHGSTPTHAPATNATAVVAHAVAMPSAQALAAAAAPAGSGQAQPASDGTQHNQVVSKVVADSLNGGDGHGPNIDHLLNSLPGHVGGHDAIEALAAQGLALAFHGAMPVGYGAPHAMLSVEMAMQHAPPAHG